MGNIDIDIDIDKDNLKNIDIDIDIDMAILENIDIDIDKGILQNIDIDKISYQLGFGISNTPSVVRNFDIWQGRQRKDYTCHYWCCETRSTLHCLYFLKGGTNRF